MRDVRPVLVDASPAAASALGAALAAAVDGAGPAILPVGPDEPAPSAAALAPVDDGVAVLVRTSGSTGVPKTVLLPAAALRASAAATAERLGRPPGGAARRWLLALPAHHVAGVQVLLRSALAGVPAAVVDLRDGFRPATLAGTDAHLTSLVPTQLRRILAEGGAGLAALRALDAVLLGGAAADPALVGEARDAGVRVVTTYGMSETCGGCVYDGVPLRGVDVALDPDGRIRLGGAVVAAGYRDAAPDEGAFTDGWFRTADLGAWGADGRLEVIGRADDVVVTGGEKVAPALVERALLGVAGVREACVVGVPDPEWGERVGAAVVLDGAGEGLDAEAVRAAVRGELGRATPRTVRVLDALPVRGIGKPDRDAVRRLLSGT